MKKQLPHGSSYREETKLAKHRIEKPSLAERYWEWRKALRSAMFRRRK